MRYIVFLFLFSCNKHEDSSENVLERDQEPVQSISSELNTDPFDGFVPIYPGVEISSEITEEEFKRISIFAKEQGLSVSPSRNNSYCSIFFDRLPVNKGASTYDVHSGSYISVRFTDATALELAIDRIEESKKQIAGLWVLPEGRLP